MRLDTARTILAVATCMLGCTATIPDDPALATEPILESYGDRVATRSDIASSEVARSVGWLETNFYLSARGEEVTQSGRSICTVTLVAPNVVIAAAHCVSYMTCTETATSSTCASSTGRAQRLDAFVSFEQSCESHRVAEVVSFSPRAGAADIALIRLASAVPASVATPRPLATSWPADGSALRTYGYGYGYAESVSALGGTYACVGWKRFADSTFLASQRRPRRPPLDGSTDDAVRFVLPGDSGGPTFDSSGRVLFINSSFGVNPGCFARRPDGSRDESMFIGCPADGDNFGQVMGVNPDTGGVLNTASGVPLATALRNELTRLGGIAATETARCQSDGLALQLRNSPSACPRDAQPTCMASTGESVPAMPTVYRDESDATLDQFRGYVQQDRCAAGTQARCLCTERGWSCEDAPCERPRPRVCSATQPGCNDDVLGSRICVGSWGYVRRTSSSTLCPGTSPAGVTEGCTCLCSDSGFVECSAPAPIPRVDDDGDPGPSVSSGRTSNCSIVVGRTPGAGQMLALLGLSLVAFASRRRRRD